MTSYQRRVKEIELLKREISRLSDFERQFKNYLNADAKEQVAQKGNLRKWFLKNSKAYSEKEKDYIG